VDCSCGLRSFLPGSLHLIGGLCWIGVQRAAPGVVDHIALGDLHLGYHSGPAEGSRARQEILESGVALFERSGLKAKAVPDLVQGRWRKLVWNVPFNGLSALLNAGTDELMGNPASRRLILEMMLEVTAAADACGDSLPTDLPDQMMTLTDSIPDYLPSMYFDNAQRRPMELDAMYGAPIDAARKSGLSMPKVDVLHRSLRLIDGRNSWCR